LELHKLLFNIKLNLTENDLLTLSKKIESKKKKFDINKKINNINIINNNNINKNIFELEDNIQYIKNKKIGKY
jgi:hypothetical protein